MMTDQDDVRKYPKVILAYEPAGTGLPFRIAHKKVIDLSLVSDVWHESQELDR